MTPAAGSVLNMAWALWLSAPLVVTAFAAVGMWWHARPAPPIGIADSIDSHREYLRVLGANANANANAAGAGVTISAD